MLKKILKPKNLSAVMWLIAALGALAAMFFKHASISDQKGGRVELYKLGKNAAFVTNKKPSSAAADSAKSFFANNF